MSRPGNYRKGHWRVMKSSSTTFILQIHCNHPPEGCWWSQSIVGVPVKFVSVWMKRRKLSVKRPHWLCIERAAWSSGLVWIKMKGFSSRLFLVPACQKPDLRCRKGGLTGEEGAENEMRIWEAQALGLLHKNCAAEKIPEKETNYNVCPNKRMFSTLSYSVIRQ